MLNSKSSPKFYPSKEALLLYGSASELWQQSRIPCGWSCSSGCLWMDGCTRVMTLLYLHRVSITSKTIPASKIIVLLFSAINFWAHFCVVSLDCSNSTIPVALRLKPDLSISIQGCLHLLVSLWWIFNLTMQHHLLSIIGV